MELLSAAIKAEGININNSEFLITQYADDTTLTLSDDIDSVNQALYPIHEFANCSGLKANFDKTQAVWIGAKRGCGETQDTQMNITWNLEGNFKLPASMLQLCMIITGT